MIHISYLCPTAHRSASPQPWWSGCFADVFDVSAQWICLKRADRVGASRRAGFGEESPWRVSDQTTPFQLWKPHVSQIMCSYYIIMSWMSSVSSISSVPWSFHVTMRFSPWSFFWTAQLSGLRDTASWCRFPVHAAPRCPWFPHVPQSFSLDLSPLNRNLFCSSKWLENI